MHVLPYLFLDGRCEEAVEYYKVKLDVKDVMLMRFSQSPDPNSCGQGDANKIMHAQFKIGDTTIFLSDGQCTNKTEFKGFALSIAADTVEDCTKYFNALAVDGQVTMPLTETFFAKSFGMVQDKFGMHWMVIVNKHM